MLPCLTRAVKASLTAEDLAHPIQRVALHPYFTLAVSRRMGLAMTLIESSMVADQHCRDVRHAGRIQDRPLSEILEWTESDHPLERSIGVAALNSCLPLAGSFRDGNAIELAVRLGKGKKVVVVGHFPRLDSLRAAASSLAILEKKPLPGDLPAEAAPDVVPGADLVAITGVTFLNETLAGLLALKKAGSVVLVLGPTVPLSPALLDHGVDVIGGAWVETSSEREVETHLAHGGMPRKGKGLRHVLMARDPALIEGFPELAPPG